MIDLNLIRKNPKEVQDKAQSKGYEINTGLIIETDNKHLSLIKEVENLREERNQLSGIGKNTKPDIETIEKAKNLKSTLRSKEEELANIAKELNTLLLKVPNMPLDEVPFGKDESENYVSKSVGEIPVFDFDIKNHAEIAESKDWLDKKRAAKIAGSRFNYIKGPLVSLQFAIIQYVLDVLTKEEVIAKIVSDNNLNISSKAFVPVIPPALIKTDVYEASGRLDAEEVTYKIDQDELWLNASAEHSLCTMYKDEIISEDDLPIRYIGYSTSFRREAGTYGKDTEGLFRSHQFDKLEMEVFSLPENGYQEHLLLIAIEEYLMQSLKIPYQVLMKCTADIGFPNARGVDIEAWLPAQNKYRETHSADYITDFQARRLKTRFKKKNGDIGFVHTNDATAFALSRAPIAIIENYQQKDGSVLIPDVLQTYMGNKKVL